MNEEMFGRKTSDYRQKDFSSSSKGFKRDSGKTLWGLIPWKQLERVAEVMTFGTKVYPPNNWQKVEDGPERYFNALVRHVVAWRKGEKTDSESGLPHLAHAACCVLFMMWFDDKE